MLSLKLGNFLAMENLEIIIKMEKIKDKVFSLRNSIVNTILIGCRVNENNDVTISILKILVLKCEYF